MAVRRGKFLIRPHWWRSFRQIYQLQARWK